MNRLAALAAAGAGAYAAYRWFWPGYDFRGKTALVTGGSRGLGLVLARELGRRGANLAVCSRDADELAAAHDDLARTGVRVVTGVCDVTDRAAVRRFVADATGRLGPVDVLVNNAGVIGVGAFEDTTVGEYEESFRTHVLAALYTTLEVLPAMKARRAGRVVNVSSFGGKVAVPHLLPYAVGKFGLVGLSGGLRAELARYGIVVTTVCPGLMRTGSHIQAEFKGRHEEEYRWFALGNALPGLSMSAERAARQILRGVALGDAEVVLTLPAKAAVLAQAVAPGLVSAVLAVTNRYALPGPGGVGTERVKGYVSRGATPDVLTAVTDRASARNNEIRPGVRGESSSHQAPKSSSREIR